MLQRFVCATVLLRLAVAADAESRNRSCDGCLRELAALRDKSAADDAIIAELRALLSGATTRANVSQEHRHPAPPHVPRNPLDPSSMGAPQLPAQRVLLQESTSQPDGSSGAHCSLQDITDVILNFANITDVFLSIMAANEPCAMCLFPCSGTFENAFLGPVECVYGCLDQSENRCPTSTGSDNPLTASATLDDRDTLIRLMETAEVHACAVTVPCTQGSTTASQLNRIALVLVPTHGPL
jgi:hypothetical protein